MLGAGLSATVAITFPLHGQVFPPPEYRRRAGTFTFEPAVFREHRERLMRGLKTGLAVVFGADQVVTEPPAGPVFRQDPDFAWLTGITDEHGAVLLLAAGERDTSNLEATGSTPVGRTIPLRVSRDLYLAPLQATTHLVQ
ncbi:aminopeptidase P N-terminal domain-containing protein [Sphingorhabdus sp.]|uniref:aminopeptidase P N-terminal domain-containing protein n=1 Tax=Sphingorhabdus sp. TaxID=1902408 RepID=UPI0025EC6934|nr:aminopeptidase P N-terminal domain-containing protein [Sphingorhabdus sp.]